MKCFSAFLLYPLFLILFFSCESSISDSGGKKAREIQKKEIETPKVQLTELQKEMIRKVISELENSGLIDKKIKIEGKIIPFFTAMSPSAQLNRFSSGTQSGDAGCPKLLSTEENIFMLKQFFNNKGFEWNRVLDSSRISYGKFPCYYLSNPVFSTSAEFCIVAIEFHDKCAMGVEANSWFMVFNSKNKLIKKYLFDSYSNNGGC